MNLIREYIHSLASKDLREDGRKLLDYRKPIIVEYGISSKAAEGSARAKIGNTEVVAGVKMEIGDPFPDMPDEGTMIVNVELLPLSNPEFEPGPPDVGAVELARVVDRAIRESQCIDVKKLCIKKGDKVWIIFIDIYPINDEGNLFDTAFLAAIAALKDAKIPVYDKVDYKIDYSKKSKIGLPLNDLPIEVTVIRINNKFIIDPSINEEEAMDARLTVGLTEKNEICAMQKGGDGYFTIDEIIKVIDIAIDKSKELRKAL